MAFGDGQNTVRKPRGHVWISKPDGQTVEFDTLQCKHCGRHWTVMPGSGRRRGFCVRCNGPTCGKQSCETCIPKELFLDNVEKGRASSFRPIVG